MAFPLSLNIQNSNHFPKVIHQPPAYELRERPKGRASQTPATHNAEGNQSGSAACLVSDIPM